MKSIILDHTGGTDNLIISQRNRPEPAFNEVLIKTHALSVNPVDYKVRANEEILSLIYGDQRPAILGWDVAGTVQKVGAGVTHFIEGDRVFGMINFPGAGNAYAEFVSASADHLAKIPEGISFTAAAASTLAALTALQALEGRVEKGHRILIHAGSGGVGHFAIQIAKAMGAYVCTTSSAQNRNFVLDLGADEHIDYRAQRFEQELRNMDFVLDMFNGETLLNSINVVKPGSTIISLPTPHFSDEILAAARAKDVTVKQIMVTSNGEDMNTLADLLASGKVKPHVSQIYAFEEMPRAHEHLETGRTLGKVVVTV